MTSQIQQLQLQQRNPRKVLVPVCILVTLFFVAGQSILVHGWRLERQRAEFANNSDNAGLNVQILSTTEPSVRLPNCSCDNPRASLECCQRTVRSSHKMGYILTRDLIHSMQQKTSQNEGKSPLVSLQVTQDKRWELPTTTDYRDVLVVRNVYDALVSGYLYHKSGRECWLDPFGKPLGTAPAAVALNNSTRTPSPYGANYFMNGDWEKYLSLSELDPPKRGRSLCTYLNDESTLNGMRVYVHVAFGRWYNGIVRTLELVEKSESPDDPKTLLVCYEELLDPDSMIYTLRRMLEWLYPGGGNVPAFDITTAAKSEEKEGHSTSSNTQTRSELESIVAWLDENAFNDRVASLQQKLGCSGDLPQSDVYHR
jgi:hypothetical protein